MTNITVYYPDLAGKPAGMSALVRLMGLWNGRSADLCVKGKTFDDFVEGTVMVYDRME
jgi:hypothetical protein